MALLVTTVTIGTRMHGAQPSGASATSSERLIIPAPVTAGLLPRSYSRQSGASFRYFAGVAGAALQAAERRWQRSAGPEPITFQHAMAIYNEPGHLDPQTGLPSWVLYTGLNASSGAGPAASLAYFTSGFAAHSWKIGPGTGGGSAECLVARESGTGLGMCLWATGHTLAVVISPTRDTTLGELAELMQVMRPDLQLG